MRRERIMRFLTLDTVFAVDGASSEARVSGGSHGIQVAAKGMSFCTGVNVTILQIRPLAILRRTTSLRFLPFEGGIPFNCRRSIPC